MSDKQVDGEYRRVSLRELAESRIFNPDGGVIFEGPNWEKDTE